MRSSKRRINGKGSFLFIRTRNIGILWLIPILLVLLTSGRPASALAQTEVSGPITENTTWEQGKTYTVTGNVTVQAGVTLTVEQGVEVRFNAKTHLEVKGRLQAEGNADEPILFTGTDASLGWWHGILIVEDGSADLEYVTVAYAGAISTGFSYNDKSIYKTGSGDLTLKNSSGTAAEERLMEVPGSIFRITPGRSPWRTASFPAMPTPDSSWLMREG